MVTLNWQPAHKLLPFYEADHSAFEPLPSVINSPNSDRTLFRVWGLYRDAGIYQDIEEENAEAWMIARAADVDRTIFATPTHPMTFSTHEEFVSWRDNLRKEVQISEDE